MTEHSRNWWQTLLHILRSTLTLLRAEVQGLQGELRHGGTLVRELVVLGAITFVFAFFTVGLLLAAATLGLSLIVPAWAAALILATLLLLVGLGLVWRMRGIAREMESPAGVVKRRVHDHVDWWRNELVSQIEPPRRSTDGVRPRQAPHPEPSEDGQHGERHE